MELSAMVEKAYISLVGNRVTLLSELAIAASIWACANTLPDPDNTVGTIESMIAVSIAAGLGGYTQFGRTTYKFFLRTKEHILQHGRLDERFVVALMKGTENGPCDGYCQQQGMYLAAKKYHQLDAFDKCRAKESQVLVPNF